MEDSVPYKILFDKGSFFDSKHDRKYEEKLTSIGATTV